MQAATPDTSYDRVRRRLIAAGLVLAIIASPACFNYRARPQTPASSGTVGGGLPGSTDPESQVVWALLWGTVQQLPEITNCNKQPLAEVTVSTNLAYSLLTVITLGLASPARVEWRCAVAQPTDEVISGGSEGEQ